MTTRHKHTYWNKDIKNIIVQHNAETDIRKRNALYTTFLHKPLRILVHYVNDRYKFGASQELLEDCLIDIYTHLHKFDITKTKNTNGMSWFWCKALWFLKGHVRLDKRYTQRMTVSVEEQFYPDIQNQYDDMDSCAYQAWEQAADEAYVPVIDTIELENDSQLIDAFKENRRQWKTLNKLTQIALNQELQTIIQQSKQELLEVTRAKRHKHLTLVKPGDKKLAKS